MSRALVAAVARSRQVDTFLVCRLARYAVAVQRVTAPLRRMQRIARQLASALALMAALLVGTLASAHPVAAATTTLIERGDPTIKQIASCFASCEHATSFTVPLGESWSINRIEIGSFGKVGGDGADISSLGPYTATIYADTNGAPGASVASAGTQTFTRSTPAAQLSRFRATLATPLVLGPGNYWLGIGGNRLVTWTGSTVPARPASRIPGGAWKVITNAYDLTFGLYHDTPEPTATTASGSATYGDTTATLTATVTSAGQPVPAGGAVTFTFNGKTYTATTNAQGVATATVPLPPGTNAGTYANRVQASYAGAPGYLPSTGAGPLVVGRRVLWVKPTDRTVVLNQPNPPTTPPAGCIAQQTPTSACWLELTNDSGFLPGDDWSDLNFTGLRFQYSRNPPTTNASEYAGKTYRITAIGAISTNYDIRYQPGTLTVAATP